MCGGVVIDGPAQFCTSATYTVPNLPEGATVTWAAANGLAISGSANANPVTVVKNLNFAGVGTLNATINSICGSAVATPKSIKAGLVPNTPNITSPQVPVAVTGANYSGNSNTSSVTANVCIPYNTAIGINISFGNPQNLQATPIFGTTYVSINTGSAFFVFPSTSPNCVIKVEYDITCGHIIQYLIIYNTCYTAPFGTFAVSPNPASNTLKISQETNLAPAQSKAAIPLAQEMAVAKTRFEVKLFDDKGNVVLNDISAPDSKDITLNTQNLPNGFYFLHITEGKETVIKQIIIQH